MVPARLAASALAALSALALLGAGCGGSPSPAAAPVTTVEIPSQPGAEAKAPPEPAPPEVSEPKPEANSTGVFGSSAAAPESPPFVARFAAVFRSPASSAQPSFFGDDSVVLFTSRVTCDVAAVDQAGPPRLRLSVSWAPGQRSTFHQFTMSNGKASKNSGAIEIVSAPTNKGDIGRVLVDAIQGGNVSGGEIDALVCE